MKPASALVPLMPLLMLAASGCTSEDRTVQALSTRVAELERRVGGVEEELDAYDGSRRLERLDRETATGGRILKEWEGRGPRRTEPFTVEKAPWAITWQLRSSLFGAVIQVSVHTPGGKEPVELAVNTGLEGTDSTFVYETGTFYLDIDAIGSWVVRVETLE